MKNTALIAAIIALLAGSSAQAQPQYSGGNRPVMISSPDGNDPCVLGKVADMGEGAAMVFPGDTTELDAVDYLASFEPIWICDGDSDSDMVGIVYTADPDIDCGVASPVSEPMVYSGACSTGWIKLEWVEPVAG